MPRVPRTLSLARIILLNAGIIHAVDNVTRMIVTTTARKRAAADEQRITACLTTFFTLPHNAGALPRRLRGNALARVTTHFLLSVTLPPLCTLATVRVACRRMPVITPRYLRVYFNNVTTYCVTAANACRAYGITRNVSRISQPCAFANNVAMLPARDEQRRRCACCNARNNAPTTTTPRRAHR